jgi:ubiquinone/menaquinone biosynthesis C-methylase UbiE
MTQLAKHEKWWQENLGNDTYEFEGKQHKAPTEDEFLTWMGEPFADDRVQVRSMFPMDATSILDVACGAGPEWEALKEVRPNLQYTGLDITPKLVAYCQNKGMPAVEGSAMQIPFDADTFDIVHTRHLLEHMSEFQKPMSEFVRVAKKSVFIVFFIDPLDSIFSSITDISKESHYNNAYSKHEIDTFLTTLEGVKDHQWIRLSNNSPCVLKINVV